MFLKRTLSQVYSDNGTSCVTRDLVPGSTYYCLVKGHSAAGTSLPSEVVLYNTPPAPPDSVHNIHVVSTQHTRCLFTAVSLQLLNVLFWQDTYFIRP